jgi:hypothetical protein
LTLATAAGWNWVEARIAGLTSAAFQELGTARPASLMVMISGDDQDLCWTSAPLVVRLTDPYGNAVGGQAVSWVSTVETGTAQKVSDANGYSQIVLTGSCNGNWQSTVEARTAGLPYVVFTIGQYK